MAPRTPSDLTFLRKRISQFKQRLKRPLSRNKHKHYANQMRKLQSIVETDFHKHRSYEIAKLRCPICGLIGNYRSGYEFEHMMRCWRECASFTPVWIPGRFFKRSGW